jgi:hypothetical protein
MLRLAAAIAIGALCLPGGARAQSCAAEIALLAQQYALSADLPKAQPEDRSQSGTQSGSMGVRPEDLAKSGGVIAPPDSAQEGARGRVLDPPRTDDPMVTTPEVRPQTEKGETTDSTGLQAAQRAQMQSLLDAARAAQRRGDETGCLERVARARAIPQRG